MKLCGTRRSTLRFWSHDPKSLITEGGGYWRYLPAHEGAGTRFLALYSYRSRFGRAGAVFDQLIFRPLLGWATALSFDCLRLSLEHGIPARTLWTQTSAAFDVEYPTVQFRDIPPHVKPRREERREWLKVISAVA